ncbi:MAG: NAD(P)-dependent oxidoreductase [Lachnospiraceae bacterium]
MTILDSPLYQRELEEICREALPWERFAHKTILVTGATGLIGSYLVDLFLKMNDIAQLEMRILAFCRDEIKSRRRFYPYRNRTDLQILVADICDEIKTEIEWDYVIHAAGNNHPQAFASQPVQTMQSAFLGMMNLLEHSRKQVHQPERVLLLSSGEIYGKQTIHRETGYLESDAGEVLSMQPRSCYPEGKRAAETLCAAYYQEYGLNTCVARLSYIYGATMSENSTKADVQFMKRAFAQKDIILKSAGTQYRSYTYLADAAVAILTILLRGTVGEAYNVANPNSQVTIKNFAKTLARAAGVTVIEACASETEKAGYSTMTKEILNAEKLYRLGFEARVGIDEGLERILCIHRSVV